MSIRSWKSALLVVVLVVMPRSGFGQAETIVTGAGAGAFGTAAWYDGIALSGLRFGMGLEISPSGSAIGDLYITLLASSAPGVSILVEGKPTSGSIDSGGRPTFSGLCTVRATNGTAIESGVPFSVRIGASAEGNATLALILGTTQLPAAVVGQGTIAIR